MKSLIVSIEIYRDRSHGTLGLLQRAHIDKVMKMFNLQHYKEMVMHP